MSDYKELIEDLRLGADILDKKGILLFGGEDMTRIADAIEQLAKERDLTLQSHAEMCERAEQLEKERDAAVADLRISSDCEFCKWLIGGDCTDLAHDECHGEHWKWRGLEDDDEID